MSISKSMKMQMTVQEGSMKKFYLIKFWIRITTALYKLCVILTRK